MIRWVSRLQDYVEPDVRMKGAYYFQERAVTIQGGGPDRVGAMVDHGGAHYVDVGFERNDDVVAACDCPHLAGICQHVWATLLAAEQSGFLQRIASCPNPILISADEWEGFNDWDVTTPPQSDRGPAPPKIEPAPEWKGHLQALRRITETHDPVVSNPRRMVYLIELSESAAANRLIVRIGECPRKKNGEWGKPSFRQGMVNYPKTLDAADRRMIGLLAGSGISQYAYAQGSEFYSTRHRVPSEAYDVVLPLLCATERFYLGSHHRIEDFQRLRWDDGAAWEFRLRVRQEGSGSYRIEGGLQRDSEELLIAAPLLLLPGIALLPGTAGEPVTGVRFDDKGSFSWVSFLRKTGTIAVPAAHANELVHELAQFSSLPPADMPEDLRIEPRTFAGPPALKLRQADDRRYGQKTLECSVLFDYGAGQWIAESNSATAVRDTVSTRYFTRDRDAEGQAIERLMALGVRRNLMWVGNSCLETPAARLPAIVRALVPEGWRIEAEGKLYRTHGALRIGVTSGIDWLELEGGADFEGQTVGLPELLKALQRGDGMVTLGDGSYGLLPEEWLKRYRLVAGLAKAVDGRLRFTHRQASLLDALLASEPEVTFDEGFRRIRRELESFSGVGAAKPSATFKGSLRHYQQEGLGWLQFSRRFGLGACLADDMGLGKTVQVLALIATVKRQGPVLIVVPRSLVFNWMQEAARFTPKLKVLDWSGAGRKSQWDKITQHDIVLTTYGTMLRDVAELREIAFDTIVLDEAQAIKNASTESSKAVRLLKSEHRLALSGTPIENRLTDLWSLFEFLNPGLLGTGTIFRAQASGKPDEESARILAQALRPFFLRRTKEKVASELPAKTEQTIYCELDTTQRRLYDELRDHYRRALLGRIDEEGIDKSRMHILEALLRLRQAACHPGLIDKTRVGESSAKLDALLPQLQEVLSEGHKAIVFSQFTSFLAILRKRLDDENTPYEYLDGKTKNREARVRHFQENPECPLFLISLKAGGLGLNLTAAEYVFLLDPWWNPAVEAQAIDRAHRIGQTQHVFAYRLIARDTVEEKVIELQKSKRALADAIITADNAVLAGMTRETLELLLS